jgi:hypothetical protein
VTDRWVARPVVVEAVRVQTKEDALAIRWPRVYVNVINDGGSAKSADSIIGWKRFRFGDWLVLGLDGDVIVLRHEVFIRMFQREEYTTTPTHADRVLAEVGGEMDRQVSKWGEQNHPSKTGLSVDYLVQADSEYYKRLTDKNAKFGELEWADILLEEVAEALDAEDLPSLREELIQVAAVTGSWIKSIDRNGH